MADIVLPPLQAVLDLHRQSIERFGGSHGVRDTGGVEAALARAEQMVAYGGDALTIIEVAAAVGFSLCKIRDPFVDGNKRAAFLAVGLFLGLNGQRLVTTQADATLTMLDVAASVIDEPTFAQWIRAHIQLRVR